MTIHTSSYYAGQFQWSDNSGDAFNRATHLAGLAQAVETHNHDGNGHGVSVIVTSPTEVGRNLLVNGGFEVNQRGVTVTADGKWAHDRWRLDMGGVDNTASITDEATIVDSGSGHALKMVNTRSGVETATLITQPIEDYKSLRGVTVSVSVRVRSSVANSVNVQINDDGGGTTGGNNIATGAYETVTVTRTINAATTFVNVSIQFLATGTHYVDNAMMVFGSVPLSYTPIPQPDEMARCFRYLQVVGGYSTYEGVGTGFANDTTHAQIFIPHYPQMNTGANDVYIPDATKWKLVHGTSLASHTATAIALSGAITSDGLSGRIVQVTVASGLSAGDFCFLKANNDITASIRLIATNISGES